MENPSGIAALGINWKFLISQGVNFLLLVLILWWLLYKPVLKMLKDRQTKISESMALAEKNRREAEELEHKNKEEIAKNRQLAKNIVDEATDNAKSGVKEILATAEADAKKIIEKTKTESQHEKEKTINSLKQELAELILLASQKLTQKSIKPEVQQQLVDNMIEDLKKREIK